MFNNLRHASAILFCQELPRFSRNLSPWINWVPGYRQTERYAVGFHTVSFPYRPSLSAISCTFKVCNSKMTPNRFLLQLIQETMFDHTLIHTNILPAAETLPADTTTAPLTGIPTVTMPRPPTTLQSKSDHNSMPLNNIYRLLRLLQMARDTRALLLNQVGSNDLNPVQRSSAVKTYAVGCWK